MCNKSAKDVKKNKARKGDSLGVGVAVFLVMSLGKTFLMVSFRQSPE